MVLEEMFEKDIEKNLLSKHFFSEESIVFLNILFLVFFFSYWYLWALFLKNKYCETCYELRRNRTI